MSEDLKTAIVEMLAAYHEQRVTMLFFGASGERLEKAMAKIEEVILSERSAQVATTTVTRPALRLVEEPAPPPPKDAP